MSDEPEQRAIHGKEAVKELLKKIAIYGMIGTIGLGLGHLIIQCDKRHNEELYAPAIVEMRNINGDGLKDIVTFSDRGARTIFYGVAQGDSVVYLSAEQIKKRKTENLEKEISVYSEAK